MRQDGREQQLRVVEQGGVRLNLERVYIERIFPQSQTGVRVRLGERPRVAVQLEYIENRSRATRVCEERVGHLRFQVEPQKVASVQRLVFPLVLQHAHAVLGQQAGQVVERRRYQALGLTAHHHLIPSVEVVEQLVENVSPDGAR